MSTKRRGEPGHLDEDLLAKIRKGLVLKQVPPGPKPLDVICPKCRASVGSACKAPTGFLAKAHAARWKAVGVPKPTPEDWDRHYADYDNRVAERSAMRAAYIPHPAKPTICRSCGRPQGGRETRCPACGGNTFVPADPCLDCDGKGVYQTGSQCKSCWNGCGLVSAGSNKDL